MKKCTICKLNKLKTSFNKKIRSKDGLQNVCRECSSNLSKKYYQDNNEHHKFVTKNRRKNKRLELKSKIDEIKAKYGCQKCNEKDVVCLEFHHTKDKIFDVSKGIANEFSWTKIVAEINKCVCLCANCHKKLHNGKFVISEEMICNVSVTQ